MATLLSRGRNQRPGGRQGTWVHLTATVPTERRPQPGQPDGSGPRYGWQLLVVGGALATALAGWVIVAGLSVVGWLAASGPGSLGDPLHLGTQLWLLVNGVPAELGSVRWTLVPLGLSLLVAYLMSRSARAAVRFAGPEPGPDQARVLGITTALCTVTYTVAVAAVGLSTGAEVARGLLGAALIAAVGSGWGASRALGLRLRSVLPPWARPVPTAVAGALAVLILAGLAVLATGVVVHADRIAHLASGVGAGVVGGIALWAGQVAFLPNIVWWSASYALGAGFTIGNGSVIAPTDVTLGMLPSIPVLGALPGTGPGTVPDLCWLVSGVAAGVAAAVLVVRRRPAARFDETALVGGLAGVLAALAFSGLAWLTGGDLGDGRLAGAGPRLGPLLVMAVTLLGLSGMICGFVLGLLRRPARDERTSVADGPGHPATPPPADPDTEVTAPVLVGSRREPRD